MKPGDPVPFPELGPVEKTAAEWVLRQQKGLSASEENAFHTWLETPGHHAVYLEMAETSHLLDGLKFRVPEGTIPFEAPPVAPVRKPSRLRTALAAAAMISLTFFAWKQFYPASGHYTATLATEVGGLQTLSLPDGSVVRLNTDSAIRVTYSAHERRLALLHGEAYFTVAKNPERPFWVEAGPVAVRAVGTAFNVRLQSSAVDVLVTEGKVRVVDGDGRTASPGKPVEELGPLLTGGHRGQVPLGGKPSEASQAMVVTTVEPQHLKSVLAWQQGRLEFSQSSLAEVVAEFNRYNTHKIVIADPALAARRFGGGFTSHKSASLLELLQQSFGVVAEEHADETVIRLAR